MSVVLPEPISPVITTKPSVNQMVDSMYALARACCLLRYRNWGSGLSRNGSSLSLNRSRYMEVAAAPGSEFLGARAPGNFGPPDLTGCERPQPPAPATAVPDDRARQPCAR